MYEKNELLDKVWSCKCWFCRLLTRRILSRLVEIEVEGRERLEGVEAVAQGEVDVVRELKELRSAVEDLKKAVVEIKAVLADLTGPFSAFRAVEEAGKPVTRVQVQQIPVQAPVEERAPMVTVEKPVERVEAKPATVKAERQEERELRQVITGVSEVLREERARVAEAGLKKLLNVMKTIYELRALYPRSSIESIIKMLEEIKLFSPGEIELLKAAVEHVEESLKEGISHEESVLLMYVLMRQLGIKSEDVEEEAIRTVFDVLASKRKKKVLANVKEGKNEWESQQQ